MCRPDIIQYPRDTLCIGIPRVASQCTETEHSLYRKIKYKGVSDEPLQLIRNDLLIVTTTIGSHEWCKMCVLWLDRRNSNRLF